MFPGRINPSEIKASFGTDNLRLHRGEACLDWIPALDPILDPKAGSMYLT